MCTASFYLIFLQAFLNKINTQNINFTIHFTGRRKGSAVISCRTGNIYIADIYFTGPMYYHIIVLLWYMIVSFSGCRKHFPVPDHNIRAHNCIWYLHSVFPQNIDFFNQIAFFSKKVHIGSHILMILYRNSIHKPLKNAFEFSDLTGTEFYFLFLFFSVNFR